MKARSDDYVALASLYRSRAQADVDEVASYLDSPLPRSSVEEFCRHATYIRVLNGGSYAPETDLLEAIIEKHRENLNSDLLYNPDTLLPLWAIFNAYREKSPSPATDATKTLESILSGPLSSAELSFTPAQLTLEAYLTAMEKEFARIGGVELHVTSGLLGGMISQEAIKLLTGQYVPANSTVVWDGIGSRVGVWDLTVTLPTSDEKEHEDLEMDVETGERRKRKREGEAELEV
jgi:amyloid beta precursor protein binding protein 1